MKIPVILYEYNKALDKVFKQDKVPEELQNLPFVESV
jgi:hypothetical protein